jgi:hypothetical protein
VCHYIAVITILTLFLRVMKDKVTNILRLTNFVCENMRTKQLLTPYHTTLVTLSGGQDSICSLLLLYLLQNQVPSKTAVDSDLSLSCYATKSNLVRPTARSAILTSRQILLFSKKSESSLLGTKTKYLRKTATSSPEMRLTNSNSLLWTSMVTFFDKSVFFKKYAGLSEQFHLLWCNHFWQRDAFHTMLHVTRVNFCLSSTMCFYLPIESVFCEEDAREWRHKSIQRTCSFFHYLSCTQGHTKSDRVETILFNMLRGTGIAGLQALQWKKSFSSFSCQRFYPCLSYCKLDWPQPLAPLLKSTQVLEKIAGFEPPSTVTNQRLVPRLVRVMRPLPTFGWLEAETLLRPKFGIVQGPQKSKVDNLREAFIKSKALKANTSPKIESSSTWLRSNLERGFLMTGFVKDKKILGRLTYPNFNGSGPRVCRFQTRYLKDQASIDSVHLAKTSMYSIICVYKAYSYKISGNYMYTGDNQQKKDKSLKPAYQCNKVRLNASRHSLSFGFSRQMPKNSPILELPITKQGRLACAESVTALIFLETIYTIKPSVDLHKNTVGVPAELFWALTNRRLVKPAALPKAPSTLLCCAKSGGAGTWKNESKVRRFNKSRSLKSSEYSINRAYYNQFKLLL